MKGADESNCHFLEIILALKFPRASFPAFRTNCVEARTGCYPLQANHFFGLHFHVNKYPCMSIDNNLSLSDHLHTLSLYRVQRRSTPSCHDRNHLLRFLSLCWSEG